MKEIILTNGTVALVNDEDFERVNQLVWHEVKKRKTSYAVRNVKKGERWGTEKLHRFILSAPEGLLVDHENLNGLDCQRHNLRTCNKFQNQQNRGKNDNNTTGYKGVYRTHEKFFAQIYANGKRIYLGVFPTAIEAAHVRDEAAKQHNGKFAYLNFAPQETQNYPTVILAQYNSYKATP